LNPDRWLLSHPPDHLLGYSSVYLRGLLGDQWDSFLRSMGTRAYTSDLLTNGVMEAIVYYDDVIRFVSRLEETPEEAPAISPPWPSELPNQLAISTAPRKAQWFQPATAVVGAGTLGAASLLGRQVMLVFNP
jgi:hypothetical protein